MKEERQITEKNMETEDEQAARRLEQRHANMAAIHGKDTKPELIVRRFLWSRGFRYRLNHKRLPGKPDIVLLKYRTCIFVNGCFWHHHDCKMFKMPSTNQDYWVPKILRNEERDIEVQQKLAAMGWHCVTVWECELKPAKREKTLESLEYTLNHIYLKDRGAYQFDIDEESSIAAEE